MKKYLIKFFGQDYKWIIPIMLTGLYALARLIRFLYITSYFAWWGINSAFINKQSIDIVYDVFFSIFLLLWYCLVSYSLFDFPTRLERKEYKFIFYDFLYLVIFNLLVSFFYFQMKGSELIHGFILALIMEIVFVVVIKLIRKMEKKHEGVDLNKYESYHMRYDLKWALFYFFLAFVCLIFLWFGAFMNTKSIFVIDDNNVVLYTTDEYYIIAKYSVEDNDVMVINNKKITKISNDNIISERVTYKKIIKDK